MAKLSVVIPSHYDRFVQETVDSVLKNCTDVEVIVWHDGYRPEKEVVGDDRLKVVQTDVWNGLRYALNHAFLMSTSPYVMKLDAHCAVCENFDELMLADVEDNWIVQPSRFELNLNYYGPVGARIDYEHYIHPDVYFAKRKRLGLYSWRWDSRNSERKEYPVDEDMAMGGSCYMMSRKHFERIGGFFEEGYGRFVGENVEPALKTWLGPWDGRLMRNKKVWYAHLRKIDEFKKDYYVSEDELIRGNRYVFDHWFFDQWSDRVHDFDWLVDRFWPVPDWPEDWKLHKDERDHYTFAEISSGTA